MLISQSETADLCKAGCHINSAALLKSGLNERFMETLLLKKARPKRAFVYVNVSAMWRCPKTFCCEPCACQPQGFVCQASMDLIEGQTPMGLGGTPAPTPFGEEMANQEE